MALPGVSIRASYGDPGTAMFFNDPLAESYFKTRLGPFRQKKGQLWVCHFTAEFDFTDVVMCLSERYLYTAPYAVTSHNHLELSVVVDVWDRHPIVPLTGVDLREPPVGGAHKHSIFDLISRLSPLIVTWQSSCMVIDTAISSKRSLSFANQWQTMTHQWLFQILHETTFGQNWVWTKLQ